MSHYGLARWGKETALSDFRKVDDPGACEETPVLYVRSTKDANGRGTCKVWGLAEGLTLLN